MYRRDCPKTSTLACKDQMSDTEQKHTTTKLAKLSLSKSMSNELHKAQLHDECSRMHDDPDCGTEALLSEAFQGRDLGKEASSRCVSTRELRGDGARGYVSVDGREVKIGFGTDYSVVLKFRLPEASEQCEDPLAVLVVRVIEDIWDIASGAVRNEIRKGMMDMLSPSHELPREPCTTKNQIPSNNQDVRQTDSRVE
ncbi:MAG: hypothetical protein KJO79_06305 [Verrucomicrobiae bacterium]|nr:hypothetical protein [Verrucomicrobiae bacterium]NNJ86773.1 hypothetical protein [Akkermansiaceae bacterium]